MLQNTNSDSHQDINKEPLSEALRARRQKELRLEKEAERRANRKWNLDKLKTHRFWIVRAIYLVANSVWIVVVAIGGFIAWLISLLFI